MKINIICDYNENFESKTDIGHINDHQTKETFENILEAIKRLGYESCIFGGTNELINAINNNYKFSNDDFFLNLSDGTDVKYSRTQIPVLCDMLDLKYSGGGTFETALTTNKYYSCLAVVNENILAPQGVLVTTYDDIDYIPNFNKYLLKPNSEGSSIGISEKSICSNIKEAKSLAREMLKSFSEVLVEEFIPGFDVTCFVIGNESILLNEVLVVKHHGKMFFENEVLGYHEHANKTREFVPATNILSNDLIDDIKSNSVKIKNLFNIHDFCRIDYRINEKNEIYFLEINTVPAININSQVGVICNNLNKTFDEFINLIIKTIIDRFNHA